MRHLVFFVAIALCAAEHGPVVKDLIAKYRVQNIQVVKGKAEIKVLDTARAVMDARQELLSQAERYHADPNWKPAPGTEELKSLYITYEDDLPPKFAHEYIEN